MRVAVRMLIAALVLVPVPASADVLLTPFVSVAVVQRTDTTTGAYGVALGSTAFGLVGFELDVSHTPDIFGDSVLADLLLRESSVTTVMGNVIVSVPAGRLRPYASGGAGLLRWRLAGPLDFLRLQGNDAATNIGGGLMVFPAGHIGLRGDVRYFRTLDEGNDGLLDLLLLDVDLADLGIRDFWRGTVGVTFRF